MARASGMLCLAGMLHRSYPCRSANIAHPSPGWFGVTRGLPLVRNSSHLALQLLMQLLQLIHIRLLGRPADTQALFLVWLRNHVKVDLRCISPQAHLSLLIVFSQHRRCHSDRAKQTYVVHDLVSKPPVVLQTVPVLGPACSRDLLDHR